jgi:hypothetical protein
VLAVGNKLANDAIEEVALLALTHCAVLVSAGVISLGATIEGATDRTSCNEEIAMIAVTCQWVGDALGEGPTEQRTVELADSLRSGDAVERSIEEIW